MGSLADHREIRLILLQFAGIFQEGDDCGVVSTLTMTGDQVEGLVFVLSGQTDQMGETRFAGGSTHPPEFQHDNFAHEGLFVERGSKDVGAYADLINSFDSL